MVSRLQTAAILSLVALGAQSAWAVEGRILGSMQHAEDIQDSDLLRILYDISGDQTLAQNVDLNLRMSLDYFSRLQGSNSDLWRGRFYGQLRAPTLLVQGQLAPWQKLDPRGALGGQRDGQVGLRWTPRRLPQLDAQYSRREQDAFGSRSSSDDRGVRISYAAGGNSGSVGYRRVDAHPGAGIGVGSATEEWRGQLAGTQSWRRTTVAGNYEALLSRFESRDRRSELGTQRIAASADYAPTRKVTIGANALRRWGYTLDNAPGGGSDLDESAYGAGVRYRATRDLDLQLSREYRREHSSAGDIVSDYLQGDARFRRAMARALWFQAGYLGIVDLATKRGSLPSNSAYGLVDGTLKRGIDGRAELRASKPEGAELEGIQWNRVLQLRTRPMRPFRFDVEWHKNTLPRLLGLPQEDREWQLLGGYEPFPGSSALISWRRFDGTGRIERSEEVWTATASHRFGETSTLSVNWSKRDALAPVAFTVSDVLAVDLAFWLPGEWQARGNYRDDLRPKSLQRSYGLNLEKRF